MFMYSVQLHALIMSHAAGELWPWPWPCDITVIENNLSAKSFVAATKATLLIQERYGQWGLLVSLPAGPGTIDIACLGYLEGL